MSFLQCVGKRVLPLSLVYMHVVPKRKDCLAFSFVVLHLQISMKPGSLLFYKNNFVKPTASEFSGN